MKSKYVLYAVIAVIVVWVAYAFVTTKVPPQSDMAGNQTPSTQTPSGSGTTPVKTTPSTPSKPVSTGSAGTGNIPTYRGSAIPLPTYYSQQIASATLPIHVASPASNTIVSSPLTVNGEALGRWYFEATFGLTLLDATGHAIAGGHVTATSDWTSTGFVPFTGTLTFPKQKPGTKGFLVLEKDNPSGLPQNDQSVVMMVTF